MLFLVILSHKAAPYEWIPQSRYDCNFDIDFCEWSNENESAPWKRSNRIPDELEIGIYRSSFVFTFDLTNVLNFMKQFQQGTLTDHTLKNNDGFFIYIDSMMSHTSNEKKRIESPLIIEASDKCLEFYYYGRGDDLDSLSVYLKQQHAQLGAPFWTRRTNQAYKWLRGEVRIQKIASNYSIVFEAVLNEGNKGVWVFTSLKLFVCSNKCSAYVLANRVNNR